MNAGAGPLLLSVDELRAAARLAGVPVPPVVSDDDPDEPRVDLAALRGLAARGLVVGLAEADPEPAGDLVAALAVLDQPEWLLDLDLDLDGAGEGPSVSATVGGRAAAATHHPAVEHRRLGGADRSRRGNHAVGPHGSLTLTAARGGFVHVDRGACLDLEGLATACGLPGAIPAPLPAPSPGRDETASDRHGHIDGMAGFEVASEVHVAADAFALAGDLETAVTTLVDAGVVDSAARQWVDAVAGRQSAAAVRVVRRLAGGTTEVRELRWLVGGDGRVWQVDGGHVPISGDDGDRLSGDGEDPSRVRLVGAGELRAALADLLPPSATVVGLRRRSA